MQKCMNQYQLFIISNIIFIPVSDKFSTFKANDVQLTCNMHFDIKCRLTWHAKILNIYIKSRPYQIFIKNHINPFSFSRIDAHYIHEYLTRRWDITLHDWKIWHVFSMLSILTWYNIQLFLYTETFILFIFRNLRLADEWWW